MFFFFFNSAILGNLKQLCGIFEPGAFLQYKPPQNISIKVTLLKYYGKVTENKVTF